MHTVVNHLPIKPDSDWSKIAGLFGGFANRTAAESIAGWIR